VIGLLSSTFTLCTSLEDNKVYEKEILRIVVTFLVALGDVERMAISSSSLSSNGFGRFAVLGSFLTVSFFVVVAPGSFLTLKI
jgi:hypothetical protein